jgi:hypothetical protein
VQFVFTCKTCDEKITLSIYYGEVSIWNNKDAAKLARWAEHEGHETELRYEFYDGRKRAAAGE